MLLARPVISIRWHWQVLALSSWLGLTQTLKAADDEIIWQIGRADESSSEFHQWIHPTTGERQIDYTDPASDAVFIVGRSEASQHWPAFQPGSANGGAGFREHPAVVEFELPEAARTNLRLEVRLLAYSARLPALQVELNGKRGLFFQEPHLAYSGGDPAVFFQPHYSTSIISCDLSADWFRVGSNRLVLTAIDLPSEREDVRPSGFPWPGCSGLVYDAVSLRRLPTGTAEPGVSAQIQPTIFFHEREGKLFEEVEVIVRSKTTPVSGRVTLTVEGASAAGTVQSSRAFGEERLILELPAWEGTRNATLVVELGGKVQEFRQNLEAARRWHLWVVPHAHLDVGYTDYAAKVAELQSRALDDAMELAERNPGFEFTPDGFWVVDQYLAGRGPSEREQLVRAMQQGRIHVPAVHGSLFTGSASLEGLIRALYPSRRFARQHGTPFDTAVVTDVPSYSWSWASALAAAGVKYFVGASDAYRGPFLLRNRLNERSPHSWEGPDGGRVTTWYARHYHQVASLFGMPPRISLGRDSLPRFLQAYDRPSYRANDVILYGTHVENVTLEPRQAAFVDEWNRTYAYPRLQFGGFAEALGTITQQQGELPVVRGDGGPYWEDGLAANARVTARIRENSRRLPSAEKLATLARQLNPRFRVDQSELDGAWERSRLMDEHTWHADCSVRDPESDQARRQGEDKDARASEAQRAIERLLQRCLSAIADVSPAGPGSVLIFNPLSWERTGVMELDIGRGQGLVDVGTGQVIPLEVLRVGRVYQKVRFLALDVPALGYRALRLRPLPTSPRAEPLDDPAVLESPFYRVALDSKRGAIRSLIDRQTGRELVDTNNAYALGQWLYVTGGDELPSRLVQYSTVSPIPALTVHAAELGRLVRSGRTGFGVVALLESETFGGSSIQTEVMLPAQRKEVRLTLRVRKAASLEKEAAYVAFPWALPQPRFRFATQNGWVDPAGDMLPGACLEWFTVQDWVGVEGGSQSVVMAPLDAPLVTFGDIVRGTWPTAFGQRPSTIFSYVMSNYTPEGYAASQGGEFVFRYVLTSSADWSAGEAARFGAEALTPLEANEITRSDKLNATANSGDSGRYSGLRVTPKEVQVVAWKPAEDGRGAIVRLLETAGRNGEAQVAFPGQQLRRAFRCTAVEDDLNPLDLIEGMVRVAVPAYGIVTLRCELSESERP
ncbi:MAG TPA: polysaccharide lyase family protein [Verrucomicrobiota bacterium]|nr:polysaccharide lyase family protein [Verrucomicrobiota bacterium]